MMWRWDVELEEDEGAENEYSSENWGEEVFGGVERLGEELPIRRQ